MGLSNRYEEPLGKLPECFKEAKAFHGHLGPNVTLGLRMGQIFAGRLGDTPFSFKITAFAGKIPPLSCLIDGLQLSTPCTVGNGYLQIVEGGVLRAVARKEGKEVDLRVRPESIRSVPGESYLFGQGIGLSRMRRDGQVISFSQTSRFKGGDRWENGLGD